MKANIPHSDKPRIVIIGGGFGGLKLAQTISNDNYQIVLIDRNNHHQFQPLFYQVATAGLEPSSIAFPFRKIFQKEKDFHFRMAEVSLIQPEDKVIQSTIGMIHYDYLIIATGADSNFFGNEKIESFSMPMKSISEALSIRNTIFQHLESAITANNETEKNGYLNIVIVGGGPTGVEIAGTLAEMRSTILPKDYPEMDFSKMKIYLIEGAPRVLNAMSEVSSGKAREYLKQLGVEVFEKTVVEDYDGEIVNLRGGEKIPSKSLIWAAGIKGNQIEGLPAEVYVGGGRLVVDAFNQVKGCEGVFAVGDVACMISEDFPKGHPQMAQPAIQQGKNLAKNLNQLALGKQMKPFIYTNLGSMATIGRNKAVVELPRYKFQGFFAWFVWMVVHLKSILGIKNKFIIFLNWVWNYFTYNLSLRLIIVPRKVGKN
jgi:NADH:ubiquinone reductase (H+-translocating)